MNLTQEIAHYPIHEVVEQVLSSVKNQNVTLLQAPPGSGKSTVLPLHFLESHSPQQKVILVQPRRLAAKAVAERLSQTLGEPMGQTIGYRVRFESKTSSKTILEVVTEGILLQMLQNDPFLEKTNLLVFDEFHERSLNNDLNFALARYAQQHLNPNLKILLMSATLDSGEMLKKMPYASFVQAHGKMFPVKVVHHQRHVSRDWFEVFTETLFKAHQQHKEGHILGFLPGKSEIFKAKEILERKTGREVFPLFGEMSLDEQRKAVQPSPHQKIILATNIAETSLTIEGVKVVVDSGWQRKAVFDHGSGLQKLETVFISLHKATQRMGRAGRTSEGHCYKCWSLSQEESMPTQEKPEILEADLSSLLLTLANWGSLDLKDYEWLDLPPAKSVEMALETLDWLGAVHKGKITEHGKKMATLPMPVRLSNMILKAQEKKLGQLAIDLAVMLEEKDFLAEGLTADLEFRLVQLKAYREKQPYEGTKTVLERLQLASEKLSSSLSITEKDYSPSDCDWVLALAFPERIAKPIDGTGKFKMANGKVVMLPKNEHYLKTDQWLVVASYQTNQQNGHISLACQTKPENHPERTQTQTSSFWDKELGWFKTEKITTVSGLEWKKQSTGNETPNLTSELMALVAQEGFSLFSFEEKHQQFINRVGSLRVWNPEEKWPTLEPEAMKETLEMFLLAVRSKEDLQKVQLLDIFNAFLGWEISQRLEMLAPEKLKMPSGFDIPLDYSPNGELPILRVKMQEIFGMAENPKVNQGKTDVLVHLLSPRGIPVQITKDLMSFWSNTYHQVVKELRMNYPKHYWPENPLEAQAIRGTKRQNGLV